jgi:hypothetical protein
MACLSVSCARDKPANARDRQKHSVGGRVVAMVVMLFGIGFLSVLTATIASRFVQQDAGTDEVGEALARIEAEVAEVKRQLAHSA